MQFAQSILDFFGFAMQVAYGFLTKDLTQFAPDIARVMETLNNGLQAFSYALLVILTLWNVVKTTSSYAELKRPEVLVKMLIRFILTKYVIGAAWSLVNGIFVVTGSLIEAIFRISGLVDGNVWAGSGFWRHRDHGYYFRYRPVPQPPVPDPGSAAGNHRIYYSRCTFCHADSYGFRSVL